MADLVYAPWGILAVQCTHLGLTLMLLISLIQIYVLVHNCIQLADLADLTL